MVDAKGRYVMPGIIDCHSHTAIDGNVNEGTDVITAEVRIRDVIDHRRRLDLPRARRRRHHDRTCCTARANAIGGQNAVIKLRWGRPPEELVFEGAPRGIKFALGENPKRSNFRVPASRATRGTRMGVEVVLRERFLRARAYKEEWADYEAKLKSRPQAPRSPCRRGATCGSRRWRTSSTASVSCTPTATAPTRS